MFLSNTNYFILFDGRGVFTLLPKVQQKRGTLHDFACHPCAGAMLIFSLSVQF